MSIRIRLAVVIGLVAAAAIAAIAFVSYALARDQARAQIDAALQERAGLAGDFGQAAPEPSGRTVGPPVGAPGTQPGRPNGGPPGARVPRETREGFIRDDVVVQGLDASGEIWTLIEPEQVLPVDGTDLEVAAGAEPVLRDVEYQDVHYRMLTSPILGGAVQIARDLSETDAFLTDLRNRLLILGLGGVAAVSVVAWFVARRALRPVAALTSAAEHVAATTDLGPPIAIRYNDEIGRLAASFNAMLATLATSRRQQERLVADAGHELRTPLTSLRTNIEVLAARGTDLTEATKRELLDDATFELEQLTALVSELVELAGDSSPSDRPFEEVSLDRIVADVVERTARRTGRTIEVSTSPASVIGRRDDLRRALANLLDNAHKWSPPGTALEVVQRGGHLEVLDRGPGIPEGDLERVFERFFRGDRARALPGSGLGLAIVQSIVNVHGGRVWARNRQGGGSAVGFEVPMS